LLNSSKFFRLANLFSRGLYQGKGVDKERPVAPIKEDYDFGLNNTIDNIPYDQIGSYLLCRINYLIKTQKHKMKFNKT